MKDELRQIMEGLGLEDSNEIQYSEFLAATMDMNHAIREENILRAFQHFDTNGSGENILYGVDLSQVVSPILSLALLWEAKIMPVRLLVKLI